eukprot:5235348-Prymnesium_polylepis.1
MPLPDAAPLPPSILALLGRGSRLKAERPDCLTPEDASISHAPQISRSSNATYVTHLDGWQVGYERGGGALDGGSTSPDIEAARLQTTLLPSTF